MGEHRGSACAMAAAASSAEPPRPAADSGGEADEVGVLMLDRAGRVAGANREARRLLDRSGVVFVDADGVVRCREGEGGRSRLGVEARRLVDVFPGAPGIVTLPRDRGLPILLQHVAESAGEDAGPDGGTLVLMRDAGREPLCAPALLQAAFGLTLAEAGVVARLAAGRDIAAIAAERDVGVVTVRNQLKAAQAKMGVRRQAELVSLALRVARL